MCAFWHVLLFCWSLRSRVLLLLVMPMTCVSFYLTDAQLRCEHSGKRHTHMSEQIFLQCLMQTNTVLVFAWVKSVLCTMIALSARLRLLSVWKSRWTFVWFFLNPNSYQIIIQDQFFWHNNNNHYFQKHKITLTLVTTWCIMLILQFQGDHLG